MPLPGGPANKIGNLYEQWWTVLQLMRVVRGEVLMIQIEQPGLDHAEFVVKTPTAVEYHQARLSHFTGKWTLSALAGILRPAFGVLAANSTATFTFVSGSGARDLRELSERARNASDLESFRASWLNAASHQSNFQQIVDLCPKQSPEAGYAILRRIHVTTIDEDRLKQLVEGEIRLAFSDPTDAALDRLRCLVLDSVHRRLERDAILSALAAVHVGPRKQPAEPGTLIDSVTESYLQSAVRRLIHRRFRSTPAVSDLVDRILNASGSTSILVTGGAGSGKSVTLYGAIKALRTVEPQIPILAVRLDRADPTPSADELGRRLGLGASPALVIGAVAERRAGRALLVIDQLDAVSTVSGRRSEFLDSVEKVLEDIEALRTRLDIHVVVACRQFDWENDHRLRRLLPRDAPHIAAPEWSDDQIRKALDSAGFDSSLFSPKQMALLRLPLHLLLLLESSEGPAPPRFSSANDLFDLYWNAKRRAVNARAEPVRDCWQSLIQQLAGSMSEGQQLSVPMAMLDPLSPAYVEQAASEGVIAVDRRRVSFWHESFFDYCFARTFVSQNQSLVSFMVTAEQHLFRRAQVRQVLQYLRDADPPRYCRELAALLRDSGVRWHVKDVAVAVALSMENPTQPEWDLFYPWIAAFLTDGFQQGAECELTQLVGRHFLGSETWFPVAAGSGLIRDSLRSDDSKLVGAAVGYLLRHHEHQGDAVALLLSPHVGSGHAWDERFRRFFRNARFGESRALFDFFLTLLGDGTLDTLLDDPGASTPFYLQVHTLADRRPEWIPELLGMWFQREADRPHDADDWRERVRQPHGLVQDILQAAETEAEPFVQHLLRPVLKIAEKASSGEEPPVRDSVWDYLFGDGEVYTVSEAVLRGLAIALKRIVGSGSNDAEPILRELRSSRLYLANWLLLSAYTAGEREVADQAARELCANPWRFDCGAVSNPYWIARQLVAAIAPRCSASTLTELERNILEYQSSYEQTAPGRGSQGFASFNLLCGIPRELRSSTAQRRYQELERKFREPYDTPSGPEAVWIGSPIRAQQAAKMNNEQWLRAISKHDHWRVDPTDISKGGPRELSRVLTDRVREEPERFAKLILRTPPATNSDYIAAVLRGLKETEVVVSLDSKLKVCRKARSDHPMEASGEVADLLGAATQNLPDEALEMLASLATEHPNPSGGSRWEIADRGVENTLGRDLITAGINCTRGKAVYAIAQLIARGGRYVERFRDSVEQIVRDKHVEVRAVAGAIICNVTPTDSDWAFKLFVALVSGPSQAENDALLTTRYVRRFLAWDVGKNFVRQRSFVLKALRSDDPDVKKVGAELASAAMLSGSDAADLVELAHAGDKPHRMGIALVAADVVKFAEHRGWAEEQLERLFADADRKVQRIAAGCFRSLEGSALEDYEPLITLFCSSPAFPHYSYGLLHALEESSYRLPGVVCSVLIGLFERSDGDTWNIQSEGYIDPHTVVKLIMRIYHQHPGSEWASRCLDLFDKMSLSGMPYMKSALEDYER